MAFTLQSNFNDYIQGLFESDSHRYIRNANAYLISGSQKVTGSAVTLEVKDSTNTQQYFLTTVSNPAIQTSASIYFVDAIQVDSFPAGNISLIWSVTSGSTNYVLTSSVSFDLAPAVTIVQGQTQTLQDYKVTLGQPKIFSVKLQDYTGNAVDASSVQLQIYDTVDGSVAASANGSLARAGSGLYSASLTLSETDYSAGLQRYEAYWTTSLGEVEGSRQPLAVNGPLANVKAAPTTYSTNEDLRKSIVGIQSLLTMQHRQPGEIEIALNQKRYLCSLEISAWISTRPNAIYSQDLLKSLEMTMVWRDCLIDANAFSKFAGENTQISELNKKISRIKQAIFGSVYSISRA